MKVKLKLIKIERKGMAGLIALLGVALILCVVAFPTPNDISVGEMAYQKLWLGRMTVVFAVCCLPFLCLNKKQYLSFPSIVTWVLIILGGIEAIWGLRQIYGFAVSNHSLYALTGSFYNPGPYSGYLAMIFPLCLHEWLNLKEKTERTWIEQGKYYMALGVMLLILCVLPAGMSRSAWIAAAVSGAWVYGMHISWGSKLKEIRKIYKRKVVLACIAGSIIFIVIGYSLFQLKATSANGRLFMWKISTLAIAESPLIGRSKIMLLFFISIIILLGAYYWKNNQYDACKNWYRSKMLYNIGAYQSAKEEYETLYPELKNRGAFLFEYGYCLHKLKQYDSSTKVLKEAMEYSNDPMILNIIGKNYQAVGKYEKAEESLIRSTHRLPGRIYPYYLLAKLYAEPENQQPEKLKRMVEVVLTKEPKVQSTAVKEMRAEVKKLLKQIN